MTEHKTFKVYRCGDTNGFFRHWFSLEPTDDPDGWDDGGTMYPIPAGFEVRHPKSGEPALYGPSGHVARIDDCGCCVHVTDTFANGKDIIIGYIKDLRKEVKDGRQV